MSGPFLAVWLLSRRYAISWKAKFRGNLNLGNYLDFSFAGGSTTIDVKSAGLTGSADQKIVLTGVDLSSIGTPSDIISNLLANGRLITD